MEESLPKLEVDVDHVFGALLFWMNELGASKAGFYITRVQQPAIPSFGFTGGDCGAEGRGCASVMNSQAG